MDETLVDATGAATETNGAMNLTKFAALAVLATLIVLALAFSATAAPARERILDRDPLPMVPAHENFYSGSAVELWGRLPLRFEMNRGQSEPNVRFLARTEGCTIFVYPNKGKNILDCTN